MAWGGDAIPTDSIARAAAVFRIRLKASDLFIRSTDFSEFSRVSLKANQVPLTSMLVFWGGNPL